MRALLDEHDFAYTCPFWIDPEGEIHCYRIDLRLPYFRELFLGGENRIPLSCGAHTLDLYRRLPAGWRTTPDGTFTDLYMWQQILSVSGCRVVGDAAPTVLHFPSPERIGWSSEERLEELDRWAARLDEPGFRAELTERVLDRHERRCGRPRSGDRTRRVDASEPRRPAGRRREAEYHRLAAWATGLEEDLRQLSASVTWRLRARLLAIPGLRRPVRGAAKALAGRAAPGAAGSESSRSDTRAVAQGHGISSSGSAQ